MKTDERVVKALEKFELPVFYAEIPENEIDDMNFFYFRETTLERSGTAHFLQTIEVAYVSTYQENLKEEEIIDSLEKNGLKFRRANYERVQMAKTNTFVDVVIFEVTRPLKRERCM